MHRIVHPFEKPASMSHSVAIFHKQLGNLVLLEAALRRLAHGNSHTIDLITRSGFQPIGSLIPFVKFRTRPSAKCYEALWCFDDRRKSAFYSLLTRAREKHLLINPGASIQWYHSRIFPTIPKPDHGSFRHRNSPLHQRNGHIRFHLPITCTSTRLLVGEVRTGPRKDGQQRSIDWPSTGLAQSS